MEVLAESPILLTLIIMSLLFLLLASGTWIGSGIGLVGLFLFVFFVTGNTFKIQGMLQFNIMNSLTLCAVPLFIFMGEIMLHTAVADKLYRGVTDLVAFFPGGLLHSNIVSCAIFAAVSGSSLATAATIGTTAIPELLDKRDYDTRMVLGSLAAGGTLGILIPPSICMIIYGSFTNQSLGQLFIAGLIPGIILAILFMAYITIRCILQPHINPSREPFSPKRMLAAIPNILPSALLMLMVLGTIYIGIATPTESAALGVIGAMIIALIYRQLNWSSVRDSGFAAIKTTAMITLIIVCAQMMSMSMSMLRIPTMLSAQVASLEINRWWIMAIICLLYMALGCVLEATSMQLLTLPVVFPVIVALDFDPIWFGVVVTVLTEMAQITPPIGINLFIIQGVSGGRSISDVALGILPFFACQILLLVMVCLFPVLSLWLPAQMIKPY